MTQSPFKKVELPEFIFGNLSTPQGRLQQARLDRVGFYHDCNLIPTVPQNNKPITIQVKIGADVAIESAKLYFTNDGSYPCSKSPTLPLERINLTWDTLEWCYLEEWGATIPPQSEGTLIQYYIQGLTTAQQTIYSPYFDLHSRSFDPQEDEFYHKYISKNQCKNEPKIYSFYVEKQVIPNWFNEAIIYQIFVDRFAPNPDQEFSVTKDLSEIYGGTLKGITNKLDYLLELGINCLWLTPIFPSNSHHGYDAIDYSTIEPRFGNLEDFQDLINKAHQQGIKVILDYVANHVSQEHPAFLDAQKDKNSPTYPWFSFKNWPKEFQAFYDLPSLPKINTDNPQARNYLITNAQKWLALGADGFRLDHAHGVTHSFWSAFRHQTRITKPDSITFGEITDTPALVRSYTGRMDGVLDFELLEILRECFAFETLKVSEFDKRLKQHYAYFGSNLVMPSFLDNHDMNRFLWSVKGNKQRLKLAALCQFTLPNPPIIYYGTEVGLSQVKEVGRLEEARQPMVWGSLQDRSLYKFYQDLIKLRNQPNLRNSPLQTTLVDDSQRIYIYTKGDYQIVLHNHPEAKTITKPSQISYKIALKTEPGIIHNQATNQLQLPPYSGCIFLKIAS